MVSIVQRITNGWHRVFPQMPTTFLPTIAPPVTLSVLNISPRRCQQMLKLPAFRQVIDLAAEFGYQGFYLSGKGAPADAGISFILGRDLSDFVSFYIPADLSGEKLNSSWAALLSGTSDFRSQLFEKQVRLETTSPVIFCRGFSENEITRIKALVEGIKHDVHQFCSQLDQVFLIPGSSALSRVVNVDRPLSQKVLYCFLNRQDISARGFTMALLISLQNKAGD